MAYERQNHCELVKTKHKTTVELSMLSARRRSNCSVLQPDGIHDCHGIDCCRQMLRWCHFCKVFRSTVVPMAQVHHSSSLFTAANCSMDSCYM